jgi:ATP-dependent DNA helicase PIF1
MNNLQNKILQNLQLQNNNLTNELITAINTKRNIFIAGGAGTGKSTLAKLLPKFYTSTNIQLTSTTGVTSINIGGQTIHRWSGIKLGKEPINIIIDRIKSRNKKAFLNWTTTQILLIDEIGFLDAEKFVLLDKVAQGVRKNKLPFGGLQIIVTGDFLQLPPVNGEYCFTSDTWSKLNFYIHELTKPYRFDDNNYFEMLSRARIGKLNDIDCKNLYQRVEAYSKYRATKISNDIIKPTRIYSTNKDVDSENQLELKKLKTTEYTFSSVDKFYKEYKNKVRFKNVVSEPQLINTDNNQPTGINVELNELLVTDEDTGKTYIEIPTPLNNIEYDDILNDTLITNKLNFKVDAQVMLTTNLDVENGLANGSRGIITNISKNESENRRKTIGFSKDYIEVLFTNNIKIKIERYPYKYKDDDYYILRHQFPLILAWSSNFHKLQGKTLDYAIMDVGTSIFSPAMAYVGLSRVKNYKSLFLVNFFREKVYSDDIAIEFVNNNYKYIPKNYILEFLSDDGEYTEDSDSQPGLFDD